jgi:hypothetical protein
VDPLTCPASSGSCSGGGYADVAVAVAVAGDLVGTPRPAGIQAGVGV